MVECGSRVQTLSSQHIFKMMCLYLVRKQTSCVCVCHPATPKIRNEVTRLGALHRAMRVLVASYKTPPKISKTPPALSRLPALTLKEGVCCCRYFVTQHGEAVVMFSLRARASALNSEDLLPRSPVDQPNGWLGRSSRLNH